MLTDLHVRDLGVISELSLGFGAGMTALTGETGAGKTLLVHALGLVLGGRPASGLVRSGAEEALVEAHFDQPEERTLVRTVPVSGRSRAWVDGRMAPVGVLGEEGAGLVDIHGQHDQQSLLGVAGQRAALDHFAGTDLDPLADARRALADVVARLAALGGSERDRAREMDLLRYQVAEIDAARLCDLHEDEALAAEEERLAHASALREAAAAAVAVLRTDDGAGTWRSASGSVGAALNALGDHDALGQWARRLRDAAAELDDIASDLRAVSETWEDDPARLEEVQARRRLLHALERKYGETLAEVAQFGERARRELAELEGREHEAGALELRRREAEEAVRTAEAEVRGARAGAAPRMAAAVTERLRGLAMPDAAFAVEVGEDGAGDVVRLLLSANRGEPPQPLSRVASGGELARTMLALRLVVEGGAPTMLFDEVDAGVGGAAALALGQALRDVARHRQVLVVTHLPQVAAFADHQVAVKKSLDADGRTVTSVEPLDAAGRVVELSRMLSGHPDSTTARAHAEELLLAGQRDK